MKRTIDLNCDLGESFGSFVMGNDQSILPYVSSANIACGFHAGDPHVMARTVKLAKENAVAVGAHPGFQDIQGFGRRSMPLTPDEVYELVLYQIGAMEGFCRAHNVPLHHVKPHGALYNMAAKDYTLAEAIAKAVKAFDSSLLLYGLAGSELIRAGKDMGLQTASEGFADRTYQSDGTLTPRNQPNAVIHEADAAVQQVIQMVEQGTVTAVNGEKVNLHVDTICLHGDNEHAILFAHKLHETLCENKIEISKVQRL
ncbi:LamB/YcsF family protein [Bacillus tianshenii]|uniref:LamB/YcsF family protein n=1 Tax=Sutcliffiella tianshenii TaxID=1463404 RepID=UPI001CD810BA|nr:5-oxoprolinase subunit PxpA [Bacillus tianshenii]MCA1320350.1 LamB/YcsF family protein [Bacillus tianshenii]